MEGQIKWYSEKKGFGFITCEEHGDLFLHKSGVKEYGHFGLQADDAVTFEVKETQNGKQAYNVRPIKAY